MAARVGVYGGAGPKVLEPMNRLVQIRVSDRLARRLVAVVAQGQLSAFVREAIEAAVRSAELEKKRRKRA